MGIFSDGVNVEDDPADREKHHRPPANQLSVRPLYWRVEPLGQDGLMKPSSGRVSNYEIRASAASHDSAKSSVDIYTKESFLVSERNLLEICAVAVRTAQVSAGSHEAMASVCSCSMPSTRRTTWNLSGDVVIV